MNKTSYLCFCDICQKLSTNCFSHNFFSQIYYIFAKMKRNPALRPAVTSYFQKADVNRKLQPKQHDIGALKLTVRILLYLTFAAS